MIGGVVFEPRSNLLWCRTTEVPTFIDVPELASSQVLIVDFVDIGREIRWERCTKKKPFGTVIH